MAMDRGASWIVCFMGFLTHCIIAGLFNCSGIILAAFLDEFKASRTQTGE